MWKTFSVVLIVAVSAFTAISAKSAPDGQQTNAPAKVSIRELLESKDRWNSNRVEVLGYYRCFFEHSVLTSSKGEPFSQGIWIDTFRIAPIGRERIDQVTNGPVRVVGIFKFYKGRGAGHLNMCPAEITNLELLEESKEQLPKEMPGKR